MLRNDLQSGGELRELIERYETNKNHPDYQAMMDVITRANWEKLEEERRMCEALRELFAEDLREAKERGEELGKEIGKEIGKKEVASNLQKMGMEIEYIAQAVGETVEVVKLWMENTSEDEKINTSEEMI